MSLETDVGVIAVVVLFLVAVALLVWNLWLRRSHPNLTGEVRKGGAIIVLPINSGHRRSPRYRVTETDHIEIRSGLSGNLEVQARDGLLTLSGFFREPRDPKLTGWTRVRQQGSILIGTGRDRYKLLADDGNVEFARRRVRGRGRRRQL